MKKIVEHEFVIRPSETQKEFLEYARTCYQFARKTACRLQKDKKFRKLPREMAIKNVFKECKGTSDYLKNCNYAIADSATNDVIDKAYLGGCSFTARKGVWFDFGTNTIHIPTCGFVKYDNMGKLKGKIHRLRVKSVDYDVIDCVLEMEVEVSDMYCTQGTGKRYDNKGNAQQSQKQQTTKKQSTASGKVKYHYLTFNYYLLHETDSGKVTVSVCEKKTGKKMFTALDSQECVALQNIQNAAKRSGAQNGNGELIAVSNKLELSNLTDWTNTKPY